jgi:STE24 endopeptidase
MRLERLARLFVLIWLMASQAGAQAAPAAQSAPTFDVNGAVAGYLAKLPADKKARSDAYFEGGYWLQLWDFLYGAAVSVLLLTSRFSSRMRDFAGRVTRFQPLRTALYWALYVVLVALLTFPLTAYEGYFREHQYSLATQDLGGWLGDQAKGLLLSAVLGGLVVTALFGLARRLPQTWHVWGAATLIVFQMLGSLLGPVYIAPLFNTYKKLDDPQIKDAILRMARANGIPFAEVYQVDASRQSNRVSANVSGFLGTERITLNDNLLKRCSPAEIEAVMGHEMGHYVLNHIYRNILFNTLLTFIAFAYLRWALDWSLKMWGARWGIDGVGDVAVIPLVALLLSLLFFVLTPINNAYIRAGETEADIFGLNASRQPDGFAEAALKLSEYRKMEPGPVEEWLMFDHPSGRTRITAAMRWKAENLK